MSDNNVNCEDTAQKIGLNCWIIQMAINHDMTCSNVVFITTSQ